MFFLLFSFFVLTKEDENITENSTDTYYLEQEEDILVNDVSFVCVYSSDKNFQIGNGKRAISQPLDKTEKFIIPERIYVNKSYYTITKLASYSLSETPFVKIVLPKTIVFIGTNCFENCPYLETVDMSATELECLPSYSFAFSFMFKNILMPKTMIILNESAFFNTGLTSVKIGKNIEFLGDSLYKNTTVTEADLSASNIKYIPNYLFENCTKLTSVFLPEKLKKIGENAFMNTALTNIELPSTIVYIGKSAFMNCHFLNSIDLSSLKLTIVSDSLFKDCSHLETINLPDGIIELQDYCFSNTSINEFEFSKTIEKLGIGIFFNCLNLEKVDMSLLTYIEQFPDYLFSGDEKLSILKFSQDMKRVGKYTFNSTKLNSFDFTSFILLEEGSFQNCNGISSLDLSTIRSPFIPNYCFNGCTGLMSIEKWPKGILKIGKSAFQGTSISKVSFSEKVIEINEFCFADCSSLVYVDLSLCSLEHFHNNAFANCGNIAVIWPQNDINFVLGDSFFSGSKICDITLPCTCTEIGKECFSHCTDLKKIDMSATLITTIPSKCFEFTSELTIKWPQNTLKHIKENAFSGCKFSSITLPETVTSLGESAFSECQRLIKVEMISTQITSIPKLCFSQCSSLIFVSLPPKCTSIGEKAFMSSGITFISLPESVTLLDQLAFFKCEYLQIIDLHSTKIKEFPEKTFYGCRKLKKIYIPNTLTSCEYTAFEDCSNLDTLIYYGSEDKDKNLNLPYNIGVFVTNNYPHTEFAHTKVTNMDKEKLDNDLETEKEEAEKNAASIIEESNSHRNENENKASDQNTVDMVKITNYMRFIYIILILSAILFCVFIYFRFIRDPYEMGGSDGIELEGEESFWTKLIHKLGFQMSPIASRMNAGYRSRV